MRVRSQIYVVRGPQRAALYDFEAGLCVGISGDELRILENLSQGRQALVGTLVRRRESAKALRDLALRGWIVPGSPKACSLEVPTSSSPDNSQYLQNVWLELTGFCNLRCKHCYASSGPDTTVEQNLSDAQWREIVIALLKRDVRTITFMGGEPTTRLSLVESIASLINKTKPEVAIRMFSNLAIRRLRGEIFRVVKKYNIRLGVSLYGDLAAVHDDMTAVKGSYQRTIEAISEAVKEGISPFVGCYVDVEDRGLTTRIISELKGLGVTEFRVLAPSQVGRGSSEVWVRAENKNVIPRPMQFSVSEFDSRRASHNCFSNQFAIQPDGKISPCIMMRDATYGDARVFDFSKLTDNTVYLKHRSLSKDNIDGCKECEFRLGCFDCRPDAIGTSGDVYKKPNCGYDPRLPLD